MRPEKVGYVKTLSRSFLGELNPEEVFGQVGRSSSGSTMCVTESSLRQGSRQAIS